MRIMLMTDLEGVAGVKNSEDWCHIYSLFYGTACRLLTEEVNAAVDGLFAGGAKYIQVADGHGCGAVDIELLDPRVEYARGWAEGAWPFGLDEGFDGIAWVGQHAKASTEYAHLCHTGSFNCIDLSVNGVSVGEFGQFAYCGSELGIPAFFASGDVAFTREAETLAPGIVTCAVKRGVQPGRGEDCTTEEYRARNAGAVHVPPRRAGQMIRESAKRAMDLLREKPPHLIPLQAPFKRVVQFRPDDKGKPKTACTDTHLVSVIELMRMPMRPEPVDDTNN